MSDDLEMAGVIEWLNSERGLSWSRNRIKRMDSQHHRRAHDAGTIDSKPMMFTIEPEEGSWGKSTDYFADPATAKCFDKFFVHDPLLDKLSSPA